MTGLLERAFFGNNNRATLQLIRNSNTVLFDFASLFGPLVVPIDVSGVLAPGRYDLIVEAGAPNLDPFGSGSFEFRLEVIPEPHAGALLGLGLLLLGWQRRPRTQHTR